jgi:molybdate transport system substrate-binding protein
MMLRAHDRRGNIACPGLDAPPVVPWNFFHVQRRHRKGVTVVRRLAVVLSLLVLGMQPASADVLVFAAASLKNALDDAANAYTQSRGERVAVAYAASSALARQIENGAPAALFISADRDWMDYLAARHLIRAETRTDLLGNRLVLIAPAASNLALEIKPGMPLAADLGGSRLALADPDSVPAGKYAKAALEALGVWSSVEGKLAQAENVRAALFFVARGEAALGIVYETDAAADKAVRVLARFPADTHPPIVYPAALTAAGKGEDAAKFLMYLQSPEARAFFETQGFTVLR